MKSRQLLRNIPRFLTAAVTALLPGMIMIPLLSPDREIKLHLAFLLLLLFTTPLEFLEYRTPRRIFRGINLALRVLWFFYILVRILIVPLSSFFLWFDLALSRRGEGSLSSLFIGLVLFFSSIAALPAFKKKYGAAFAGTFLSLFVILSVIYRSGLSFAAALGTAVLLFFLLRRELFSPGKGHLSRGIYFPPGAALVFSLVLSFTGQNDGSFLVDNYLFSGLRGLIAAYLPDFPLFELTPGYGRGYTGFTSGERPTLTSAQLLKVEGIPFSTYYLRENVYSAYKDGLWSNDADDYRLPEVYARKFPVVTNQEDSNEDRTEGPGIVTITVLSDFDENLLSILNTGTIQVDRNGRSEFFKENGGIRIHLPLTREEKYRLIPDETPPAPPELPPGIFSASDSIPLGIRELAQKLKDPLDDPEETARRITSFLIEGYTYSLDTKETTGDLAAHFLFSSRKGYCVHFATAFVMLYRACGFPARFVSGYLTEMRIPENAEQGILDPVPVSTRRLTGYASHTWPEIWLPEKGWITWETTPPMVTRGFFSDSDRFTLRSLREAGLLPETRTVESEKKLFFQLPRLGKAVFVLPAAVILILVITLGKRRGDKFRFLLKNFQHEGSRRGLDAPAAWGWRRWIGSMAASAGRRNICLRAGFLIEKAVYSKEKQLSSRDRNFLRLYLRYLKKHPPA